MASPTPSFMSGSVAGSWRTASALRHRCPFPYLTTGSRADAPWKNDQPPVSAYGPCPPCGQQVLTGETPAGGLVALDTHVQSYTVLWMPAVSRPWLSQSRGYPVHRCLIDTPMR